MTNPKLEKTKTDIAKTKAKITEYQCRLRDLEKQKTDLENLDIIALYRKERFSEDEFAALLRMQRKSGDDDEPELKEGEPDAVGKT
jgi:septal ring factor EnvC (AmiA/AmiB activator)